MVRELFSAWSPKERSSNERKQRKSREQDAPKQELIEEGFEESVIDRAIQLLS